MPRFVSRFSAAWPAEKDARLAQLWDEGLTTSAIAATMEITKNAVIGRAHRLGLAKRPSPIPVKGSDKLRKPRAARPRKPKAAKPQPKQHRQSGARSLVVAQAVQPVAPPPPPAPRPEPRPMIRLGRADGCRFPLWGRGKPTHVYCDAPRARSFMPYCEAHCRVAYQARDAA